MKKKFLFTMFVMLMTSISSFAQKEYNMVITLSNGTTVTLGHNDIKEITFNDGDVAISGNMVNTIDSLAQVTSDLNAGILKNYVYNLEQDDRIQKVAEMTDENFEVVNENFNIVNNNLQNMGAVVDENFALVQNDIAQLYDSISKIIDVMEKLHPELAETSEYKNVKAASKAYKKNIAKLPVLNKVK